MTELLLFSKRRPLYNDNQVILDGRFVSYGNQAKFLGIIIDNKINFRNRINYITGKIAKHAGILYRIKHCLPLKARITYYNSFVLPYLNFNILHWGNTNASHLQPLVVMQKRIIRTIADADYLAHSLPLFKKSNLLKKADLYKFHAIVDTHKKILKGGYEIEHNVNTRHRNLSKPKYHRLDRTRQSIATSGPNFWNDLPIELRSLTSIPRFKKNLKTFLLSKYVITED